MKSQTVKHIEAVTGEILETKRRLDRILIRPLMTDPEVSDDIDFSLLAQAEFCFDCIVGQLDNAKRNFNRRHKND